MHLYAAIFMAVYFGMLRIGEVTQGPHVLLAQNVHMGENKNKILFILRSLKMHCKGDTPQTIKISGMSKKGTTKENLSSFPQQFCPFMILKKYVEICPYAVTQDEQFFVFSDNSPVKPDHVRNHLRLMLKRKGYKEYLYSFHGICTGRAGDLLKLGIPVENIKKLGRWKSNAVFRYLKYL